MSDEQDVRRLLDQLSDGLGSPDSAAHLEELLKADPLRMETYLEHMELVALLSWQFGGIACPAPEFAARADETGGWSNAPPSPRRPVEVNLSPQETAAVGLSNGQPSPPAGAGGGRRPALRAAVKTLSFVLLGGPIRAADRRSTAAALVISYAVFYGLCFLIVWSLRPDLSQRSPRELAELAELNSESVAKGVATLVEASDCVWESGAPPVAVGDRITTAQLLRLSSGKTRLRFDGGAEVGIVGPVIARAISTGYVRLERGRLAAHVPTRAFGFTVETASARLVDLGTDFAVDVNAAGETEMIVTRGAVEVTSFVGVEGERRAASPPCRVKAGQTVRVASSGSPPLVDRSAESPEWVKQLHLSDESSVFLIAYQATNGDSGNQGQFSAGRGLDFDVLRPIQVEALGAFDHLGDGFDPESKITVQLWSRDNRGTPKSSQDDRGIKMLAEQVFEASSPGVLMAGHRFKSLPSPIELPIGSYTIVGYGFSPKNPFFTFFFETTARPKPVETWRGAIAHVNSRQEGSPGQFPPAVAGKVYCFNCASFKFRPLEFNETTTPAAP